MSNSTFHCTIVLIPSFCGLLDDVRDICLAKFEEPIKCYKTKQHIFVNFKNKTLNASLNKKETGFWARQVNFQLILSYIESRTEMCYRFFNLLAMV